MKVAIHSYDGKYEVVIFNSLSERSIFFSTELLGDERALAMALELDEKIKEMNPADFDEANEIIDTFIRMRDHEYIDNGMGIIHDSVRHQYIAIYQYFDSDYNFRMTFSKTQLGQQIALKVTKKFLKDVYDIKSEHSNTNNDIDLIIEKYSLYKAKQQINREKWKRHKIIGKL